MKKTQLYFLLGILITSFLASGLFFIPTAQAQCPDDFFGPVLTGPLEIRDKSNGDLITYNLTTEGDGEVEVVDVRGLPWWARWDEAQNMVVGQIPQTTVTSQVSFTVDLAGKVDGEVCNESSTRVTVFWSSEEATCSNSRPVLTSPLSIRGNQPGDQITYAIGAGLSYNSEDEYVTVTDVRGLPSWLDWVSSSDVILGTIPDSPVSGQESFDIELTKEVLGEDGYGEECSTSNTRVTLYWGGGDEPIDESDDDDDEEEDDIDSAPISTSDNSTSSETRSYFEDLGKSFNSAFADSFFRTPDASPTQESASSRSASYSGGVPCTVSEIRAFQCAYDIVCSGSIETTGYGNMGPRTTAMVEQVFGVNALNQCSVQSASNGSRSNPNQSSSGETKSVRVVRDVRTTKVSPSIEKQLPIDKCQSLFPQYRTIGYDGTVSGLWCKDFDVIEYTPGNEKAAVMTDIHMIYPSENCSTLGEGWERIPGTSGKNIAYCQKIDEISYEKGNTTERVNVFLVAVRNEKSSNPVENIVNEIKEFVKEIVEDIENFIADELLDDLVDVLPDGSLLRDEIESMQSADDADVNAVFFHDKADKEFLEVKASYSFGFSEENDSSDTGGNSGSGNDPFDRSPFVYGTSTNTSSDPIIMLQGIAGELTDIVNRLRN